MINYKELSDSNIQKKLEELRAAGVIIPLSDGIIVSSAVEVGKGSVILPGTVILGSCRIGRDCVLGPGSHIADTEIGDGVIFKASFAENAVIKNGAKIGPFCNIRPNSDIGENVKIGDFVEVKNSVIGSKTSVAHLTYVGDSDVGSGCNFGCGVVTVNYDGSKKHRTTIGNDVFIGCNVNLVAPVEVSDRAYIAAGSTVTENVPADSLAIARSRQTVKEGWRKR